VILDLGRQIHRAARNPVELDMNQANAVEARIQLDLRIGAAFTRLQTLTLQPKFEDLKEKVLSFGES
jgi:DNA topoisomerase III